MVAQPVSQPRAAIYVRVSTDKQEDDGTSLATQEQRCRQYAAERGYQVTDIYRDVHTGMELWERPRLTTLREAVRRREVAVVVSYAIDRLARDPIHMGVIISEAEHAGVSVEFVTEVNDDTPEGQLVRYIRGYAAKVEHEKIRERAIRGLRARVESGKLKPSNRPLFGYRWRDTGVGKGETKVGYDVDETTAPVVRRIFAEYLAGRSLRKIAEGLTADGIITPTGKTTRWCPTTVHYLLTQRTYTGDARAFAHQYEKVAGRRSRRLTIRPEADQVPLPAGTVTPLINPADFEAVQERLGLHKARNSGRPPRDREAALLRGGYVRCGYCGNAMNVGWRSGRQVGRPTAFYRCNSGSRDRHGCPHHTISAGQLDAVTWRHIEEVLTQPQIVSAEVARLRRDDPTRDDLATIERALREAARMQANLTRKLALFDDDEGAAPLVAEISALGRQKRRLEEECERVLLRRAGWQAAQEQLDSLEAWCRTIAASLGHLDYDQKRLALDALGVEVRVFRADHTPRYVISASIPLGDLRPDDATPPAPPPSGRGHTAAAGSAPPILSKPPC